MNRLAFAVLLFLAACNNENKPTTTNEKTGEQIENTKQSITEKSFGSFEGAAITEYTITNASGMQVGIINYGGTITKIITPDKNKNMGDVVLGYESIDGFVKQISTLPKDSADERISFDAIKIDDALASVWTPYQFFYAGKFSHCGVNSFQLVRLNGIWKIQYLIDTRRRNGCL